MADRADAALERLDPQSEGSEDAVKGVTPFLWFDDQAEQAANLYVSLFDDAEITGISRYPEEADHPDWKPGEVMTVSFRLQGQDFVALNGGPRFSFSQATSFVANCETQEEIDRLWEGLSEGGQQQQCGWLIDRFGVTWQVVPTVLGDLLGDPDPGRAQRATLAMLSMSKFDIQALIDAADG